MESFIDSLRCSDTFSAIAYVVSAILFIFGLKLLSSPATAVRGNLLSAGGMFLAVMVTLMVQGLDYRWIVLGIAIGALIGYVAAIRVQMTGMPEMVALFNGSGGLASLLVGAAEYTSHGAEPSFQGFTAFVTVLAIVIGGVTFTGSLIAWAKLSGYGDKPLLYPGQQFVNSALLIGLLVCGYLFTTDPGRGIADELVENELATALVSNPVFLVIVIVALILGVLIVSPIGGADMPVAISLLNSYSGLAACAAGYVIQNSILIVAGGLVGASGLILTRIMCKAMNRSLANVLFGGFGAAAGTTTKGGEQGEAKSATVEDAYYVLEAAASVVIVPGYGLAVAQAQHAVRELGDLLEANGAEVKYAIHPVAGRMPGHMNVLLAEANVPYEQLVELGDINPQMETMDVCIVIGANDVVNTSARDDESSTIYGMPIINADKARNVYILKRSMASGFAGIANPLFFKENARLIFGDAKATVEGLIRQFKD